MKEAAIDTTAAMKPMKHKETKTVSKIAVGLDEDTPMAEDSLGKEAIAIQGRITRGAMKAVRTSRMPPSEAALSAMWERSVD